MKTRLMIRMRSWHGDGDVPDPSYGGQQGFEADDQMCLRTSAAILNQLER
jgi:protein-tyrosine-phosphatase